MVGTKSRLLAVVALTLMTYVDCAFGATATHRVRMYFNVGSVDIDLYGNESPLHVANFLEYVNDQAYDRTWIHRSFCCGNLSFLQGGEFYLPEPGDNAPDLNSVVSGETVLNEYDPSNGLTNSPGTLSAARTADLDSARNGWFINTTDNSTAFPNYTVFGEVTRGFDVVEFISSLPINHPYLASFGYGTAPINNNGYVYQMQVVERSLLDGDFDSNGLVGASDLAQWEQGFGRLQIEGPDFNGDKEINSDDLSNWEAGFGRFDGQTTFADFEDGDANRDGTVDGFDFLRWQRSVGSTTDVAADGDGNAQVDGFDFLLWQRNFGATTSTLSGILAVPEPTSFFLAVAAGLLALYRPRR
ncbi:MAG: hypothetical protein GXP28_02335 [Planctomycetes bacterium]|nr:hypothetical protein [Planctomycetota bacterium]